jgi:hypothetical protein
MIRSPQSQFGGNVARDLMAAISQGRWRNRYRDIDMTVEGFLGAGAMKAKTMV